MGELLVLHTADLHGTLSPEAAGRLGELKARHRAVLLDGGDALSVWNITNFPWRLAVGRAMELAGYDAVGLGNREFCFRARCLGWAGKTFPCPLVASNLQAPPAAGLKRMVILPHGSQRVAVLALARRMIAPDSWVQVLSNVRWLDPVEALGELLPQARREADWTVVLSHLGHEDDLRLAGLGLDFDVLLASHDHVLTPKGLLGLGVPVVYSGWHGRWATLTRLRRGDEGLQVEVEAVALP